MSVAEAWGEEEEDEKEDRTIPLTGLLKIRRGRPNDPWYPYILAAAARESEAGAEEGILLMSTLDGPLEIVPLVKISRSSERFRRSSGAALTKTRDR